MYDELIWIVIFEFVSFNVDPSDRGLLCRDREMSDLTVQNESEDNFRNSGLRCIC